MRLVPHYEVNKSFSVEQEEELKIYCVDCALLFFGLSTNECGSVAYEMANVIKIKMPCVWIITETAGINWHKSFRKRHPDLSFRKPEVCNLARASASNRETYQFS